MKLHTRLGCGHVAQVLDEARDAGRVSRNVGFAQFEWQASRSHASGFLVQLGSCTAIVPWGTVNRYGAPQRARRVRQHGYGSALPWAATWHEWGWFMAGIFSRDPGAWFGRSYHGAADFHSKTHGEFVTERQFG